MQCRFLALGCLCFVLFGCASDTERLFELPRRERSLGDISRFFSAVASADEVKVYEGLPHQGWDRALYERELKRPDIVWIDGYPFYARPLPVTAEEKRALTVISLRKEGHVPFSGFKLCGGYHPDYAIVWKKAGSKSGSLICFGCHEWKNFTPDGRLYEDLGSAAYEELRAILGKYVVQRPTSGRPKEAPAPTPKPLTNHPAARAARTAVVARCDVKPINS